MQGRLPYSLSVVRFCDLHALCQAQKNLQTYTPGIQGLPAGTEMDVGAVSSRQHRKGYLQSRGRRALQPVTAATCLAGRHTLPLSSQASGLLELQGVWNQRLKVPRQVQVLAPEPCVWISTWESAWKLWDKTPGAQQMDLGHEDGHLAMKVLDRACLPLRGFQWL